MPELLLRKHDLGITIADQPLGISRTILGVSRVSATDGIEPLIKRLRSEAA